MRISEEWVLELPLQYLPERRRKKKMRSEMVTWAGVTFEKSLESCSISDRGMEWMWVGAGCSHW